jgi:Fic family protein
MSPVAYHIGKFPPGNLDWSRLVRLIGPANAALARYDGLLSAIPNSTILLSPLTTQEAVMSSKIEGTQATMGEVLEFEAGGNAPDEAKINDIHEVLNYRKAMRDAVESLTKLPICGRVIKQAHAILLDDVRGSDKARGSYRTIQNYIAKSGQLIEEARFVPIAPEELEAGMSRWEKYLHEDVPDRLVQLAIVHAEFESLHPFLDGNGRVGRILIPMFLSERKLLQTPMFYISEYLERHRQEYYDRLLAVSRDDDWTGWCEFFLIALTEQAAKNEQKTRQILNLYHAKKEWMISTTHSQFSITALDFLFNTPVFSGSQFIQKSKIPAPTARRILRLLSEKEMLKVIRKPSGQQAAIYAFSELVNISEGRTIF